MWLVLPPTISSQSAQASEDLDCLSKSHCEMLTQFATWRGKPKQQQSWQRAWKTAPLMKRLSGLTCPHSKANLGVEQWIASLPATRANQTVLPAHVEEPKTTASLSTNLCGLSTKCGLFVSSVKTSQGTRTDSSQHSSQNWKQWATALRQEYSQRQKWAHPIDASDCSSWRTPDTGQGGASAKLKQGITIGQNGHPIQMRLETQSQMWQTPKVSSGGWENQKDGSKKLTLQGESENWPTIQARDWKGAQGRFKKNGALDLPAAAETWPTPLAADSGEKVIKNSHQNSLIKASDAFHTSHQAQATQDGEKSSDKPPRLNPLFVQWLMGWLIGWTNYARPVTGYAQWLEQSRGYLSRLILNKD